jgi:hypothetical protein
MVLGSGIQDPEKTYSGSRIQGSKSTQSRIRNTAPKHGEKNLCMIKNSFEIYLRINATIKPSQVVPCCEVVPPRVLK